MNDDRALVFLRRLARLLVRGPEARYIQADIEDAFDRDLARGLSLSRARWRYGVNVCASAASVCSDAAFKSSRIELTLALRMLVKHPGLTCVAVFALAVGIPAGIAPLHVANAIEAPLPVAEGDRVRALLSWNGGTRVPSTVADFERWREGTTAFEALAAWRTAVVDVGGTDAPAPVAAAEVSATTFEALRARARFGRTLQTQDERTGAARVVVIGHDLWQARFDGDRDAVGHGLTIGGRVHTVVGVMPPGFSFPTEQQLWLPLRPDSDTPVTVFGRLADGVTAGAAEAAIAAVDAYAPIADGPERPDVEVAPAVRMIIGLPRGGMRSQPGFRALQLVALVPLLVACLNVGLLVAARVSARSSEFAVRMALGADRRRIVSQVFTETLVLALVAATLGLLAFGTVIEHFQPLERGSLPYWIESGLTAKTVIQALALAVVSAVLAGVLPVLKLTKRPLRESVQRAGARPANRFGGWTGALIVLDVAIAVVAIGFTAALLHKINAVDAAGAAGFPVERFLAAEVRMPGVDRMAAHDLPAFEARLAALQTALVERLRREPGVLGAAVADALPRMQHDIRTVEADAAISASYRPKARVANVSPGFFAALGQSVLAGRDFHDGDARAATVIINATLARKLFGGGNPVGKRMRYAAIGGEPPGPWLEIVGIVPDLGMHMLSPEDAQGLYHAAAPGHLYPIRLGVHVGGDPASFIPQLRAIVHQVDASAVLVEPAALATVVEGDWYLVSAAAAGGGVLVAILLTLAASAIFALLSFAVAERAREIGIRVALGADRFGIASLVTRRALLHVAAGVVLGTPVAGRIFFEILDDRGTAHAVWSGALLATGLGIGILFSLALVACAVPTARALRIAPSEVLKEL